MPYILDRISEPTEIERICNQFKVSFSETDIEQANQLLIEASSFNDPGQDWTRFILYKDNVVLATQTLPDY